MTEKRFGNIMSRSIFRAWLAHPAYKIKNPQAYRAFLNNPAEFVKSLISAADVLTKNNHVRQVVILNDLVPFHVSKWIGDLPDMNIVAAHESATGIPCLIAVNAVFSSEFKKQHEGKMYELSAPWLSIYYDSVLTDFENSKIEKDFCCPINRLDPNRQSWFYLLIRRNLLDKGFVSFNLDHARTDHGIADLQPLEAFEHLYQTFMSNFSDEHKIATQLVPYRNFPADENLDSVLMKSRFNIIVETFFPFNDQIMITEKTIRSLRLPRPWILYGAKGTVAQLKKWGLDVLDDLVDHNRYDSIENDIERQTAVLDLAQELCNFDTIKHWDRLKAAAVFNNEVLLRWKNAFPQTVFDDFYRILDDYAIRNNLTH